MLAASGPYNANPSSMKLAIENLAKVQADFKILMLGAMMELGDESVKEHGDIIQLISNYKWDEVVVAGKDFINLPSFILKFNSAEEIASWFKKQAFKNATILIKGSRSMAMEKVLE